MVTRVLALFRRESILDDIDQEMRSHLEMQTQANIERGIPPEQARLLAFRSFGNAGWIRDLAYDVRGGGMLDVMWQDLRYARVHFGSDRVSLRSPSSHWRFR